MPNHKAMSYKTAADFIAENGTKYISNEQGWMPLGDVIRAIEDYASLHSQRWVTKEVKELLDGIIRKAIKLAGQGEDHIWRPAVQIEAHAKEIEFLIHTGRDIAPKDKAWSVLLSFPLPGNEFNTYECDVKDVGHSDRVLMVECEALNTITQDELIQTIKAFEEEYGPEEASSFATGIRIGMNFYRSSALTNRVGTPQAEGYYAGMERMLAHEQAGGDGWWKGWEMLKEAHSLAQAIIVDGEAVSEAQRRTEQGEPTTSAVTEGDAPKEEKN